MVARFPHRRLAVATAATVMTVLGTVGFQSASATTYPWPGPPSDVHIAALTTSSLTLAAHKAAHTAHYRMWVSASMPDLYAANLTKNRPARKSATSANPKLTVASLSYRSGPIYYRFANVNGPHRYLTKIETTYLRPATPSPVAAMTANSLALKWSSTPVTGYVVEQSNNPAFTVGVTSYTLHGLASQFTPYRVKAGHSYYFRVGAVNGNIHSTYSRPISATAAASEPVTMMTYNIMSLVDDGHVYKGLRVQPWMKYRKAAAAKLIESRQPDIIAIQEGGALALKPAHQPGVRQVDTLRNTLGTHYTVAHTEPTTYPNRVYAGSYIIYNNTRFAPVGAGSNVELATGKYDACQVLRDKQTRAEFEACSVHLSTPTTNANAVRREQTTKTVNFAQNMANDAGGVPILYGGDFASALSNWDPDDVPGAVMRSHNFADALTSAQTESYTNYSTENWYRRDVHPGGVPVDRIFVGPGVGVMNWTQLMNLSHGQLTGVIPSDHNPVVSKLLVPIVGR